MDLRPRAEAGEFERVDSDEGVVVRPVFDVEDEAESVGRENAESADEGVRGDRLAFVVGQRRDGGRVRNTRDKIAVQLDLALHRAPAEVGRKLPAEARVQ